MRDSRLPQDDLPTSRDPRRLHRVMNYEPDTASEAAIYHAPIDQHPSLSDDQGSRIAVLCAMDEAIAAGWSRADLLAWVNRGGRGTAALRRSGGCLSLAGVWTGYLGGTH